MKFFKYVDARGLDILKNERIKFTPPHEFKDPFEMHLSITARAARAHSREMVRELERKAEKEIPGYKNVSHRQRKKGRKEMVKMAELVPIFRESFQGGIENHSVDTIGICSLCGSNESNLMWYHYADGHRGFVLEFDGEDADFRKLGKPWQVNYTDRPPRV